MWVIFCPQHPKLANMKTVKSFITFPKTGKMYKSYSFVNVYKNWQN